MKINEDVRKHADEVFPKRQELMTGMVTDRRAC